MTAVGQTHTQNCVATFYQREEYGTVSLGARVRLHIGIGRAIEALQTINRQLLSDINILTATVVALARITLGVFVGHLTTLSCHNRRAGVVLRGNQFNVLFLTLIFLLHGVPYLGIKIFDSLVLIKHG